jgi:hypothetical protein
VNVFGAIWCFLGLLYWTGTLFGALVVWRSLPRERRWIGEACYFWFPMWFVFCPGAWSATVT